VQAAPNVRRHCGAAAYQVAFVIASQVGVAFGVTKGSVSKADTQSQPLSATSQV
jgi:hypothetical protein